MKDRFQAAIFLGPALIVLGLFLVYAAYYTIRLSFYTSDIFDRFTGYVGLDNFKQLFTNDPEFLDLSHFPPSGELVNNLKWVILYISLTLALRSEERRVGK